MTILAGSDRFGTEYAALGDETFVPRYRATCYCGAVQYEVSADPVDATLCHCGACRKLHGAPMQWAAIFHKHQVRFSTGLSHLRFFNAELG